MILFFSSGYSNLEYSPVGKKAHANEYRVCCMLGIRLFTCNLSHHNIIIKLVYDLQFAEEATMAWCHSLICPKLFKKKKEV